MLSFGSSSTTWGPNIRLASKGGGLSFFSLDSLHGCESNKRPREAVTHNQIINEQPLLKNVGMGWGAKKHEQRIFLELSSNRRLLSFRGSHIAMAHSSHTHGEREDEEINRCRLSWHGAPMHGFSLFPVVGFFVSKLVSKDKIRDKKRWLGRARSRCSRKGAHLPFPQHIRDSRANKFFWATEARNPRVPLLQKTLFSHLILLSPTKAHTRATMRRNKRSQVLTSQSRRELRDSHPEHVQFPWDRRGFYLLLQTCSSCYGFSGFVPTPWSVISFYLHRDDYFLAPGQIRRRACLPRDSAIDEEQSQFIYLSSKKKKKKKERKKRNNTTNNQGFSATAD